MNSRSVDRVSRKRLVETGMKLRDRVARRLSYLPTFAVL